MHPAQAQAIAMFADQLYASAQQQLQLAQRMKQMLQMGQQQARIPTPQMPQMPDYLNQQEEAVLGVHMQQAQQQAYAADAAAAAAAAAQGGFMPQFSPMDQNTADGVAQQLAGVSPHFARPLRQAQQQRRAPQQQVGPGNFDPFAAGIAEAMGGGF
jgi:hypothetical protein